MIKKNISVLFNYQSILRNQNWQIGILANFHINHGTSTVFNISVIISSEVILLASAS